MPHHDQAALMKIQPYSKDNFDQCVDIFVSNLDKYFAEHELADFKTYLNYAATSNTYFVIVDEGDVAACGGYEKMGDVVGLTWGLVKRNLHGYGYGKALTTYRLNAIKGKYPGAAILIDTSQHTKGFYEKQGFVVQSIEKDGFEQGLDKYMMMLTI